MHVGYVWKQYQIPPIVRKSLSIMFDSDDEPPVNISSVTTRDVEVVDFSAASTASASASIL